MNVWRDVTPRSGARWAPSRYSLAGAAIAAVIVIAAAAAAIGFGGSGSGGASHRLAAHARRASGSASAHTLAAHPNRAAGASQSALSGAGSGAATGAGRGGEAHTHAAAGGGHAGLAAEIRDPEEANSYPAPPSVHHRPARAPSAAAATTVAPGAASDAQIRKELARMRELESAATQPAHMATVPGGDSIATAGGKLPIPQAVPSVVQRVIAGANAIADFPYRYGGGHASFVDTAYDCSGSVSYALAAGGLLQAPETSGQLESWGVPGPGRWITVYANAGHTYMYVNIGGAWMLYDTAGRSGIFASRWQPNPVDNEGYVVRHWPGL